MWNTVNAAMAHESARRRELERKLEENRQVQEQYVPRAIAIVRKTSTKVVESAKNLTALRPPSPKHSEAKRVTSL
jgi:hypothetical protein